MDKEKLIKLLNLSASENDGEALSAIRKANKFILENNLNWTKLIKEESIINAAEINLHPENKIISEILERRNTTLNQVYIKELEMNIKFSKRLVQFLFEFVIILIAIIIILLWS